MQHGPDLLAAEDDRQFICTGNRGQVQVLVRQPFGFKQEAQAVHGVLEIGLGRCLALLLQPVEVVFDLLRIQFSRKTQKVEGHSGDVAAIVVEGTGASAQDGDVAFKALEHCFKPVNFTAGTVEVLVIP